MSTLTAMIALVGIVIVGTMWGVVVIILTVVVIILTKAILEYLDTDNRMDSIIYKPRLLSDLHDIFATCKRDLSAQIRGAVHMTPEQLRENLELVCKRHYYKAIEAIAKSFEQGY